MISFLISLAALLAGYFLYGRFVERLFGPDDRQTPAVTKADGVDFVVLPSWKIFMIQFLNIAGTGPIFGAIMGMMFGPKAYLWIVLGCIFAGATHDYLSGMLSVRHGGAGLPDLVGHYLGRRTRAVMLVFCVFLLVMVGTVFVYSPAVILGDMTASLTGDRVASVMLWVFVIFAYYILATMLPVDKIIGRVYPLFAVSLIFMALALLVVLVAMWPSLPEVVGSSSSFAPLSGQPVFPCLFVTIACGAISGFHATQSPLMARCMKHERQGRPIFYGAMITEGIIALIWATVASWFFYGGGSESLGMAREASAPQVVTAVSGSWLGTVGGILALLGVVAAPITSGDTALRSARLIIAEFMGLPQRTLLKRLYICVPLFGATGLMLWYNIADADGFNVIWGYFAWANQTLAVFTLWMLTVWLVREGRNYLVTLIPAVFMTAVCVSYLLVAPNAFALPAAAGYAAALVVAAAALALFAYWKRRLRVALAAAPVKA